MPKEIGTTASDHLVTKNRWNRNLPEGKRSNLSDRVGDKGIVCQVINQFSSAPKKSGPWLTLPWLVADSDGLISFSEVPPADQPQQARPQQEHSRWQGDWRKWIWKVFDRPDPGITADGRVYGPLAKRPIPLVAVIPNYLD